MKMAAISSIFKHIVNLFMFKDVSIRKKLLFYAAGGLGWYLIISFVALGAITYVKISSKKLTDEISPQIHTGHKAIIKLRGANVSAQGHQMGSGLTIDI